MQAKSELRRIIRRMRAGLGAEELQQAGSLVTQRVLERKEVQRAHTVFCYVSVRREVPTGTLLEALRSHGKRVVIPRVTEGQMEARLYQEPLVAGVMNIPTSDGPVVHEVDVAICPGLAFDRSGGRIGYGAGHYDSWLENHPCHTIGICVEQALIDEVPREPHDRLLDLVITPTETLRTRPVRVVAAAWIRGGRVLAARCGPARPHAGQWELPGGKVEPGETDAEALRREILEELGATVEVVSPPLGTVTSQHPGGPFQLWAYEVRGSGEPVLTEHDQVRWLSPTELHDVDWTAGDRGFLRALHERLTKN